MKDFTWHCGASVLVNDAYSTWEVKAPTLNEAYGKALDKVMNSSVLDSGTLDMHMDVKELARELGNIASDNTDDWEPTELIKELESISDKYELISTLEWIVSNANKKGEL